ncbi:beta-glucoside operon transcriptional antiterminator [Paenibacillus turicensis]|uniref:Beta-glucoside operon transcriptional antiterminator n=1 Tax=Paenibacillus turicensis TaxID=160487 RepID=A0ABS4FTR1_9BACL|nr:PRD domain-containing protein [Paenibacillus turicensis]MBP1905972.1 beta-glucoside operon transcriptional antiterminator [Paenibacillus turicensis]
MRIAKVLNNNVITVIDDQHKESVIMGRGIAFKKQPGDEIEEERIEKIFTLENREVSQKLMTLLSDIPMEYMDISDEIIQYAQGVLGGKLHDSIYISLTDHIHFAIERYRLGMEIKNALLWEIKRMYRKEYAIGVKALGIITDKLGVTLPEDEGGFIALHLVNAQLNVEMRDTVTMTNIVKDIINIVRRSFVIDLDEESLSYYRFLTHLKFFAQRILSGTPSSNKETDNSLHDMVKQQYSSSYACAEKIKDYAQKIYGRSLSNEEMLYLTIHIERVVKSE